MMMPAQSNEQTLATNGKRRQQDLIIGWQFHLRKELYANQQSFREPLKFRSRSGKLFNMCFDISRLCKVVSTFFLHAECTMQTWTHSNDNPQWLSPGKSHLSPSLGGKTLVPIFMSAQYNMGPKVK